MSDDLATVAGYYIAFRVNLPERVPANGEAISSFFFFLTWKWSLLLLLPPILLSFSTLYSLVLFCFSILLALMIMWSKGRNILIRFTNVFSSLSYNAIVFFFRISASIQAVRNGRLYIYNIFLIHLFFWRDRAREQLVPSRLLFLALYHILCGRY